MGAGAALVQSRVQRERSRRAIGAGSGGWRVYGFSRGAVGAGEGSRSTGVEIVLGLYWRDTCGCLTHLAYFPVAQLVHTVAPVLPKYFPLGQLTQLYWEGEPVEPRYFPSPQFTHAVTPGTSLYLPAPQSVQDVTPAPLIFPTPQLGQMIVPRVLLIFPAAQLVQSLRVLWLRTVLSSEMYLATAVVLN